MLPSLGRRAEPGSIVVEPIRIAVRWRFDGLHLKLEPPRDFPIALGACNTESLTGYASHRG